MAPRKDKQKAKRTVDVPPVPVSIHDLDQNDFNLAYSNLLVAKNELLMHPPNSRELKVALEDFGTKVVSVSLILYRSC